MLPIPINLNRTIIITHISVFKTRLKSPSKTKIYRKVKESIPISSTNSGGSIF